MLLRAALYALFALTPLGGLAADVELAAVRSAKQRKRPRAQPAAQNATGAKPKRRRRRRRAKKAAPRQAAASPLESGPLWAFGLSMVATAAAGLISLVNRQRAIRDASPHRLRDGSGASAAELTDPYRREP